MVDSSSGEKSGLRRTSATLKRTFKELQADRLMDWAAALTYYALLSVFPAAIAMVSLIGLFGDPETTTEALTDIIEEVGPEGAADTFAGPIESIAADRGTAGLTFVVGLIVALWSASGYVGAFIRASNTIYETEEGRGFLKLRPLQMGITLAMLVIMVLLAVGLVMTGPVVSAAAEPIGLGDTVVSVWNVAKWPVMVALFVLAVGVLFYASPNARLRGFRSVVPGSLVALVVWAIASTGFAVYVANFGSYNETYGTLGGLIVLLIWFWITNLAILFGHELNSERERADELDEGVDGAEEAIQLEPRSEPDDS